MIIFASMLPIWAMACAESSILSVMHHNDGFWFLPSHIAFFFTSFADDVPESSTKVSPKLIADSFFVFH